MMAKNEYVLYSKQEFTEIYREISSDQGLLTVLVEMQTKTGVHEMKAYETARTLLGEVARFECTKGMVQDDITAVIDDFLQGARNLQGYDRKIVLHQMDFGLGLYSDPALLEQLKEGATADELFQAYYAAHGEDPALTKAVLETRIRRKMEQFRLFPGALRSIAGKLGRSREALATAAALGEHHLRFRCVAAMDLYLRTPDTISVADAVTLAATHGEVEAVADAVARGQMAADTAAKIIAVVCLTALVLGGLSLLSVHLIPGALGTVMGNSSWGLLNSAFGYAALPNGLTLMEVGAGAGAVILRQSLVSTGLGLFFTSLGVSLFSDRIVAWLGRFCAKSNFLHRDYTTTVADGLNNLADHMEQRSAAARQAHVEATAAETVAEHPQTVVF